MSQELYYTPPSEEIFQEVKLAAIKIWQTYDDTYGYATGKVERIKDIKNIKDNFMYMYAMFDWENQPKLYNMLGVEARKAIRERMEE